MQNWMLKQTSEDCSDNDETADNSRLWHSSKSAFRPYALLYLPSGLFESSYEKDEPRATTLMQVSLPSR